MKELTVTVGYLDMFFFEHNRTLEIGSILYLDTKRASRFVAKKRAELAGFRCVSTRFPKDDRAVLSLRKEKNWEDICK